MIKATEYLFRNCLEKTAGVSLRIDEYLSYCGEVSELLKNQTASQNVSTQDADGKDADSYVSTIGSSDAVMPSENYNDILKEIQKTKAEAGLDLSLPPHLFPGDEAVKAATVARLRPLDTSDAHDKRDDNDIWTISRILAHNPQAIHNDK